MFLGTTANSIRAIFTDLDGTLLNHNHSISNYTKQVLQFIRTHNENVSLNSERVFFIVATGRPYPVVRDKMQSTDGFLADFIITNNGANIFNRNFEPIVQHRFPPDLLRYLLYVGYVDDQRAACGENFPPFTTSWFQGEKWYMNHKIEGLGKAYPENFQPVKKQFDSVSCAEDILRIDESELQEVPQLFYYGPNEKLVPIEQRLNKQPEVSNLINMSFSVPHLLDVTPKNVSKGAAIKEVLYYLDLTPSQAIAFGDGMNDLAMLRTVGTPYLMANSMERLKETLPDAVVIGSNEEDGVARKIADIFNINIEAESEGDSTKQ